MKPLFEIEGDTVRVRGYWGYVAFLVRKKPLYFFQAGLYVLPGFFIGAAIGLSKETATLTTLFVQLYLLLGLFIIVVVLGLDRASRDWEQGIENGLFKKTRVLELYPKRPTEK